METRPLDTVREACRKVAGRAKYVHIAADRIPAYAASIPPRELTRPELDPDFHYLGHGPHTASFILSLAAINFGSGYFPLLRRTVKSSGYFTLARAWKDRYEKRGPATADILARLDVEDCIRLFRQDRRNDTVRELMQAIALAMNELGRHVRDRYDGSFTALVEAAGGSAEQLVELLVAMPRFDDVAFYEDLDVPFYKRAQLAAADLANAFGGEGLGRFDDLSRLTVFADNLVPHVLRRDGVLHYDPGLAQHVDAGDLIEPQSPEEIEIRAATVHAGELLVQELQRLGRPVTAVEVDAFLWNRGLEPAYASPPPHRTRTIYY